MMYPKYEEVLQFSRDYNLIPICKEIYADIFTPITLLQKISTMSPHYFLLESIEGGEKWARYSFLGYDPIAHVTCKDGIVTLDEKGISKKNEGDPYDILRNVMARYHVPRLPEIPPFSGGLVGYFSYGMVAYSEKRLQLSASELPDCDLYLYDKVIAYDHLKQTITIIVHMEAEGGKKAYDEATKKIEDFIQLIQEPYQRKHITCKRKLEFISNTTKEEFIYMVEQTKEYIGQGDIFQAVISRQFVANYEEDLVNAYRVLRTTNPSPYMVFLQQGDVQIISASPETLVKLNEGRLSTFPIAGSRPRGKTVEEDQRIGEELLQDEKELAEHNMLVDLGRNDLGRIAEFTTVRVTDYMRLLRYSKVMHITSEVEGRLRQDKDALDSLKAILPAGTLSGAPKIRACEIIEELEKVPRGIYGGAIGYIDFTGNMDTCIAIRMAVKTQGKVYVQAGAGIVADSVPEREFEETDHKARAVIEAIERAGEVAF